MFTSNSEIDITETPTSSNIKAFAYHHARSLLIVFFNSGVVWEYSNVPESTYSDMQTSVSVGKFFYSHIRNTFTGEEVSADRYDFLQNTEPRE